VATFVRAGGLDDRPRELPEDVRRALASIHRGGMAGRSDPTAASLADMLLSLLS
jgi:hypothetical protein